MRSQTARDIRERVGANVRAWRETRGLTQAKLAERARVSDRTIQRIEAGAANPPLDTLAAIAGALSVDVEQLLRR